MKSLRESLAKANGHYYRSDKKYFGKVTLYDILDMIWCTTDIKELEKHYALKMINCPDTVFNDYEEFNNYIKKHKDDLIDVEFEHHKVFNGLYHDYISFIFPEKEKECYFTTNCDLYYFKSLIKKYN